MADAGLIAGLAKGLQSGFESYQNVTQRQEEERRRKEKEERDALQQRIQQNLQKQNVELAARKQGLLPEVDEMGLIKGYKEMPGFESEAIKLARMKRQGGGDIDEQLKRAHLEDILAKRKEAELAKTPEGMLKKMGAEEKKRFDSVAMGVQAVDDMKNALASGERTFTLYGDNPYTESRRRFEEAIGRLQSGGAISKEEEKRFKAMAPRATDSSEIQQQKLANIAADLESRLQTFGLDKGFLQKSGRLVSRNIKGQEDQKAATAGDGPPPGLSFDEFKKWNQSRK